MKRRGKRDDLSWKKARAELASRPDWDKYVWTSSTKAAAGIPLLSVTVPSIADADVDAILLLLSG